jgi:hypothetical protein
MPLNEYDKKVVSICIWACIAIILVGLIIGWACGAHFQPI